MTRELDPEEETLIRVKRRIQYQFVLERNALAETGPHTREDVRHALQRLTYSERRALKARVRTSLTEVSKLMRGASKTFDEPRVQPSDLDRDTRFDTI